MPRHTVMIAGGGIAGLSLALTLHQIGVQCTIFESVRELKPLGVGINIQPNAVRELFDLGISQADLDRTGVPAKEWALVGLNGSEIYSEPRGLDAGYKWPQYAVHRGRFHMMLLDKVRERIGEKNVQLGARVIDYYNNEDGTVSSTVEHADGHVTLESAKILIGADGLHSAIRARMHPDQPPIHWGGAVMWRGTSPAVPVRTGSSFIGLGTHRHRMVIYPISHPDPETGLADVNWIAEMTVDNSEGWQKQGWFKPVPISDFIHHFESFRYDWLDVPEMISKTETAFVNPMIDRNPIGTWVEGNVALMGDAAHAMYPTGSNGASQAIIDARQLGLAMVEKGVTPEALQTYDARLSGPVGELVLRNRGAGPFGLLNMVDERCGGQFDNIDDIIPAAERNEFMAGYKSAAGFAIDKLNSADRTIAEGARVAL